MPLTTPHIPLSFLAMQVITLLLEAGADKDALDHQGRKAVDLLRSAMESSQAGSSDSSSSSSGSSGNDGNSSGTSSGEDSSGNDQVTRQAGVLV